jgi:hypothetical protein
MLCVVGDEGHVQSHRVGGDERVERSDLREHAHDWRRARPATRVDSRSEVTPAVLQ